MKFYQLRVAQKMRKILIDSNVLLDIFVEDKKWFQWSSCQLANYSNRDSLIINPVIYSEVSIGYQSIDEVEKNLSIVGVNYVDLPRIACFEAGKAFYKYRKNGGQKTLPLPDFFIGAHAAVEKIPLLTRDVNSYRTYFPNVILIAPHK